MIVTCTSCLTKFNLDDSKIPAKGAKVRCSRCQHVFYIVPPPETKEEIMEDFESFAKYHEDLIGPAGKRGEREEEPPPPPRGKEKKIPPKLREEELEEEEDEFLFSEKMAAEEKPVPAKEGWTETKPVKPRALARRERRRPSLPLVLLVIVLLLVFGLFYLWTEVRSGSKLPSFLEYPVNKIAGLWGGTWETEKETLVISDLNGYEEKAGEVSLYIVEGKVTNRSRTARRHIKVNVVILNQDRTMVAEKEATCGRVMAREELRNLPPASFKGGMAVKPQKQKEMFTPSGKTAPFMVVFSDLPGQAKEFKVEIVEAPSL
jgi:predicted Zn finger-like uncharacterized protein